MERWTLSADVGNSRIKFGLFPENPFDGQLPDCRRFLAVEIDKPIPWDTIRGWGRPHQTVVAGANPPGVARLVRDWPADWTPARVLDNGQSLPVPISVDQPEKVGIDRLLNAVAANVLRPADRPAIVVDSGTATTVDLICPDGVFRGGAILPGLRLGGEALHRYTALLPLVPPADLHAAVPNPLGKNTRDAIRSGLFWGQVGAVRELVSRMSQLCPNEACILVTGGAGASLAPYLPGAREEPYLSLKAMTWVAWQPGSPRPVSIDRKS